MNTLFVPRDERQREERIQWINEAVAYMFELKVFAPDEYVQAVELADSLHWHNKDEGGDMMDTPKQAVDEELTYWGD